KTNIFLAKSKILGIREATPGVWVNELHGGPRSSDLTEEVKNDIHTTCSLAAGKVIRPSEPFWLCTNWERNMVPNPHCYSSRNDDLCGAVDEKYRWTYLLSYNPTVRSLPRVDITISTGPLKSATAK
ncbi:hypothetical protein FOXB_01091, partial [Fusarium oxysporum f. sp. conglutinans Fo5176]